MALCLLVMLLVSHEDLINVALGFLLSVFAWVFDPFQLGIGGFVLGGGRACCTCVYSTVQCSAVQCSAVQCSAEYLYL